MLDVKKYKQMIDRASPKSKVFQNTLRAFLVGGGICFFSEWLFFWFSSFLNEENSYLSVTITLILLAALLTGLGIFDRIARFSGAGTLVPVTGFSNSVVSPALDTKSEGWILGVGAKIFTVAGPVMLYGILSGFVYGVIYYLVSLFL